MSESNPKLHRSETIFQVFPHIFLALRNEYSVQSSSRSGMRQNSAYEMQNTRDSPVGRLNISRGS